MKLTAMDRPGAEFATSGSTGEPVRWIRTADQLRAEAALVHTELLGPVDHVVTFAPAAHLYGKLFGEVLPELLDVDVTDLSTNPLAAVPFIPGRRTLYVCLPSSWLVLERSLRGADLTGSYALHSTGPVTEPVAHQVRTLTSAGLTAVELFGSTETGGVAYRLMNLGPAEPWRLLPDVTLIDGAGADGTCLLHVRSPRIARRAGQDASDTCRLTDVIRPVGADRFIFLGRSSRLIKINGKRCDLVQIESALAGAAPGLDARCVGVPDQIRGEHYLLFHAGSTDLDPAWLRAVLGDLPLPRAVHRITHIPRTSTGKVEIDRLFAMAVGEDDR